MFRAQTFNVVAILLASSFFSIAQAKQDNMGREILEGPVSGAYYTNVHIISDSVGVYARGSTTIVNSVIEARVCVQSNGIGLNMNNNVLKCGECIQFTGSMLMDNSLSNNQISGRGTNRPDIFGW